MINITESPTEAISSLLKVSNARDCISYCKSLFSVNFNYLDIEVSQGNYPEFKPFLIDLKAQKSDTQICVKVTTLNFLEKLILDEFGDYWLLSLDEFLAKKSFFDDFLKSHKSLAPKIMLVVPFSFFKSKESKQLLHQISDLKITKIRILEDEKNQLLNDFEKVLQMIENQNFEYFWQLIGKTENLYDKMEKLYTLGARNFVGCLHGLQNHIPTEKLISFAHAHREPISIKTLAFEYAYNRALYLFSK
ncbi:hypothetical protein EDL99_02800 [Ornithobacterium rhinotracheale]|uniref:hypothetical protein n=1 Tax=Ornithobacterium rhinotracheale TaxID=28251 RepID=UPI00129C64BB|nr:hypothetical protein [Ornithobacterium rhinotracheale]MRJ07815.1 hypothetical protein [Ornithobacterium rhinotracheale]UOH78668.1 hypothetical protein MT996_04160 [Ornithobacterium rhinotracheale]